MKITIELDLNPELITDIKAQFAEQGGLEVMRDEFINDVFDDDFGRYLSSAPRVTIEAPELQ